MEKMYELPSWLVWALVFGLLAGLLQIPTISASYIGLCLIPLVFVLYKNIKLQKLMKGKNKNF